MEMTFTFICSSLEGSRRQAGTECSSLLRGWVVQGILDPWRVGILRRAGAT